MNGLSLSIVRSTDKKKAEMKKQWQEYLPLSPEEKKQKLENYVKSLN